MIPHGRPGDIRKVCIFKDKIDAVALEVAYTDGRLEDVVGLHFKSEKAGGSFPSPIPEHSILPRDVLFDTNPVSRSQDTFMRACRAD